MATRRRLDWRELGARAGGLVCLAAGAAWLRPVGLDQFGMLGAAVGAGLGACCFLAVLVLRELVPDWYAVYIRAEARRLGVL